MERDETVPDVDTICTDFNSHAHVERDGEINPQAHWINISTHTLTWSVTNACYEQYHGIEFQLTRSRGA